MILTLTFVLGFVVNVLRIRQKKTFKEYLAHLLGGYLVACMVIYTVSLKWNGLPLHFNLSLLIGTAILVAIIYGAGIVIGAAVARLLR